MTRAPLPAAGLLLFSLLAAASARSGDLRDLYYGEALFFAHQGHWFEALERLDAEMLQHDAVDEPNRDSLYYHIDDAEFSLGDFELRYRMHHRAGRAISAVLEGAVDEAVRNDAAYRLARIHFQKNQLDDALTALDRIRGRVPESIRDDIVFLRGSVYLALDRPADAAPLFRQLLSSEGFGSFAAYNLGIAYLEAGDRESAVAQLDRAGQLNVADPADTAIRDKSNLVLGTLLLEEGNLDSAASYLSRVRLDGPFSNQALLSAGWANLSLGRFERAIVPWSILAEREVTDGATQEAKLVLPFAYGKLDVHGRAAILYGEALDFFGSEVDKLDDSIESIREGLFLEALTREEIRKDKDWVIRLRSLPEAPETYYLMELLASHDFQAGLQNYLDLADLKRKLVAWHSSFDAFDDMVAIRRAHYAPLLPPIDAKFRELDSRMRLRKEQHRTLVKRRDDLLTSPRPELLATHAEQAMLARIERIESVLEGTAAGSSQAFAERVRRLKGVIFWTLRTEYHERFTAFDRNLRSLDAAMAVMETEYESYVRARQAATHSYTGYEAPVARLRREANTSIGTVERLMARQGQVLERLAIRELVARRERLEGYRDKARFALADSYDRATQAQARREAP